MRPFSRSVLVVLALALAGCASNPRYGSVNGAPDESAWDDLRRSGATPVTHDALETVNLVELLDPRRRVELAYTQGKPDKPWATLPYAVRYDLIFAQFAVATAPHALASQRNLVQNRLMVASDRRCGRFFQYLKKDSSDTNFKFGLASGVLSTAGALVPGLRAAQNLSGLSALSSGLRAEYNNEYYANLAVSVITKGIEEKRGQMRIALRAAQSQSYAQYDVAAAVADAVQYDASCNIVYGLEQANEAIQRLNDPGRDAVNRALFKNGLARALASGDDAAIQAFKANAKTLGVDPASMLAGLGAGAVPMVLGGHLSAGATADVSGAAVHSLGNLGDRLKALESALLSVVDTVGKPSVTATVSVVKASITSTLQALSAAVSADFAGTGTTSCYGEAKAIANAWVSRQADLQFARAGTDPAKVRAAEDALAETQKTAANFAEKLRRYELALDEVASQQLGRWRSALILAPTDIEKPWPGVAAALTFKAIEGGIGTQRRCNAAG